MADLQRRVLALETTPRVGINRVVTSWGTASVSPTTYGLAEYGAVGTTWASSTGASGTGYPRVQISITSFALVLLNGRISDVANDPALFRSNDVVVAVRVDGGTFGTDGQPAIARQMTNYNLEAVTVPFSIAVMKAFPPGVRTFEVGASWTDTAPAATLLPLLSDVTLTILPID